MSEPEPDPRATHAADLLDLEVGQRHPDLPKRSFLVPKCLRTTLVLKPSL